MKKTIKHRKNKSFFCNTWNELLIHAYIFSILAICICFLGKRMINEHNIKPYLSYNGGAIACTCAVFIIVFNIPFYVHNYYNLKKIYI